MAGPPRSVEEWFTLLLAEVRHRVPDIPHWFVADPTRSQFLLMVGGNATSVGDSEAGPAGVAVDIASYLQDHVMDDLHRPWPEIEVAGRDVVFEPMVSADGGPCWVGGVASVAFGDLGGSRPPTDPGRAGCFAVGFYCFAAALFSANILVTSSSWPPPSLRTFVRFRR